MLLPVFVVANHASNEAVVTSIHAASVTLPLYAPPENASAPFASPTSRPVAAVQVAPAPAAVTKAPSRALPEASTIVDAPVDSPRRQ